MTSHIETCGAWIRHLQAGLIDGDRGVVCWTDPHPATKQMVVGVRAKDPVGDPEKWFVRMIHKCDFPAVIQDLGSLCGFDRMRALGLAQGVLETDTRL